MFKSEILYFIIGSSYDDVMEYKSSVEVKLYLILFVYVSNANLPYALVIFEIHFHIHTGYYTH